jgi:hypothetical protein
VQICTDFFLKIKSYFYPPFISNTKSLIMANRRNFLKQQLSAAVCVPFKGKAETENNRTQEINKPIVFQL